MYGCETWTINKPEHWRIDAFELWSWIRLLRVPWTTRRSNPKGNQSWIFIGRTNAEAEVPILWLHDAKSWLIRKDPDAGKDWMQDEKGIAEDEMVGWHHQYSGHEFDQALGDGAGQRSLVSMGLRRVEHDWLTNIFGYCIICWVICPQSNVPILT